MKYNDNGTKKEISVKASDTFPIGGTTSIPDDMPIPDGWEEVEENYKLLGAINNENKTITLVDSKVTDYKFITVVSGYGDNYSTTTIPVIVFINSKGNVCRQYVKTYNGYGFTSIRYIDDITIFARGAVEENSGSTGQDTTTLIYGVK